MPVCRPLGHGLWEVRSHISRGRPGHLLHRAGRDEPSAWLHQEILPKIWEAGEEGNPVLDGENINDADRLADRVTNKLADLLAAADDEPGGKETKLARVLGKLSVQATVAQKKTLETVKTLKAELADLRRSHNRQRVFAGIVIVLLAALFFVGR